MLQSRIRDTSIPGDTASGYRAGRSSRRTPTRARRRCSRRCATRPETSRASRSSTPAAAPLRPRPSPSSTPSSPSSSPPAQPARRAHRPVPDDALTSSHLATWSRFLPDDEWRAVRFGAFLLGSFLVLAAASGVLEGALFAQPSNTKYLVTVLAAAVVALLATMRAPLRSLMFLAIFVAPFDFVFTFQGLQPTPLLAVDALALCVALPRRTRTTSSLAPMAAALPLLLLPAILGSTDPGYWLAGWPSRSPPAGSPSSSPARTAGQPSSPPRSRSPRSSRARSPSGSSSPGTSSTCTRPPGAPRHRTSTSSATATCSVPPGRRRIRSASARCSRCASRWRSR